jgi:hypothetical protein
MQPVSNGGAPGLCREPSYRGTWVNYRLRRRIRRARTPKFDVELCRQSFTLLWTWTASKYVQVQVNRWNPI